MERRFHDLDEVVSSLHRTPLHIAVLYDDIKFAKKVISKKPDLALKQDNLGWTPLHLASARGSPHMVKLLIKSKPDACMVKDGAERTPLHLAAMNDRVEIMEVLMEKKLEAIHIKNDQNGDTILHFCVKSNANTKPLRLLVKKLVLLLKTPNPNSISITTGDKNNDGKTILQLAADLGKTEIIQYLLENVDMKFEINDINEALNTLSPADRDNLETRFLECLGHGNKKKTLSKNGNEHEGLKERMNTLMVVATLIAGIAFQAAMNPPGGVWQDDSKVDSGKDPITFAYYLNKMFESSVLTCSLDTYLQEGCLDKSMYRRINRTVSGDGGYSGISFIPPNATQNNVTTLNNAKAFVADLMSIIFGVGLPSDFYMIFEGLVLRDFNTTKVVSNYNSSSGGGGGESFFPYIMRYAGYPIMAYSNPIMYMIYMTSSGVAFLVSLCIILMAICGFISDTSTTQAQFLGMLMCVSILCVASSYVCILLTMLPGFYTTTLRFSIFWTCFVVCGICGFVFFIWCWISKVVKLRKTNHFGISYGDAIFGSAPWDRDSVIVAFFVFGILFFFAYSGIFLTTKFMARLISGL